MHRRNFLGSTAAFAFVGALGSPLRGRASDDAGTGAFVRRLAAANDDWVGRTLRRQASDGSLADAHGIRTVHDTAGFVARLAAARQATDSRYHDDAALLEPLERATTWLLSAQHDDGTIDLISTNFHSPPDTAFIVETLGSVAALLRRSSRRAEAAVRGNLDRFIRRAGEALATGGVHTPNHRWVVCAALARVHEGFPNRRWLARIEEWLAEGIDLDPDGQYTEKSTSVYSPVVNRALLTVARLAGRPELREPVRRNLAMTLHYVHPDGEVVTEASRRQDRYQRGSMGRYYYGYRTMARLDQNGVFAAMARQIERTAEAQLVPELLTFLEEPEFSADLPPDGPLPTDYEKVFAHSSLARIRRAKVSATILAQNSTVFSLRKGEAALEAVRFASAFFGKGQFTGAELVGSDGNYVLGQEWEGPYFQPLTAEQIAAGEAVRMAPNGTLAAGSRAIRATSNVQRLKAQVRVKENRGRFALEFEIGGTDGVPVAVELAFRHGGKLEGVEQVAGVPDAFVHRSGTGRYVQGDDVIEFRGGRAEHAWTALRGALPKWDGQSVYLTGFTPFRHTVEIS